MPCSAELLEKVLNAVFQQSGALACEREHISPYHWSRWASACTIKYRRIVNHNLCHMYYTSHNPLTPQEN